MVNSNELVIAIIKESCTITLTAYIVELIYYCFPENPGGAD